MKRQPIWIDTDAGFDDIVAIEMLAASNRFTVLGASLVAGNASLADVTDNALRAKAFFHWQFALHAGSAQPRKAPLVTAENVLGKGGMASVGKTLPATSTRLHDNDGVAALLNAVQSATVPVTVVALGPLTNIAAALADHPSSRTSIREIVLMGGSAGQGNHTAAAEFNFACDPEAAEAVFNADIPIRMFGLDVGRQCMVTLKDADAVRSADTERAHVIADLFEGYLRIRSVDGSAPMPFYDPTVAVWLVDTGSVSFEAARVDIETQGQHTRGMSVCEFRVPRRATANAQVALGIDAPLARRMITDALLKAARRKGT
jgi:purine nucleosidase